MHSRIKVASKKGKEVLSDRRIEAIAERLDLNKPLRRTLPGWGRLHIDRQLPFLCIFRKPATKEDPITGRLLLASAAYALLPGDRALHASNVKLLKKIAGIMVERFGAFLFLEIWAANDHALPHNDKPPRASFKIHTSSEDEFSHTVQVLQERLSSIKTSKQMAEVNLSVAGRIVPPDLRALFSTKELEELGCTYVGVEVAPIYVNPKTKEPFPLLYRSIKRQLSRVLDQTFYEFSVEHTTHQPSHYYALGRRAMVKAVWEVDRRLAAVSNSFDLLFQITPINAAREWRAFRRNNFKKAPSFLYRPRVIDPCRMKRALYDIPVERIEDPTLIHLFLDKQRELDRQLTMLNDLGTSEFLYESLQLHGRVTPELAGVAEEILNNTSGHSRTESKGGMLSAAEFATLARKEVKWYTRRNPAFNAKVIVSDDMYSGLLVSRGRLLIGKEARIPKSRANALIQHEIGTHLLTYYNGLAQPFKMLYSGLPGYDEMQEGLAVLSEYLVGGLSNSRLRILAARVVAAHALTDGATFIEVFRLLDRTHEFSQQAAYTVTMRVFRGGGLVKDAVYLRGLIGILDYFSKQGDLNKLFIGKFAVSHIPVIEELLHRKILTPPPTLPRYLEDDTVTTRINCLREGMSVLDLLERKKKKK